MFELAFGRLPTERERQLVAGLPLAGKTAAELLRVAISVVEQMHHPSPISVRFGPGDVEFIAVDGVSVCIDTADYAVGLPLRNTGSYEPHLVGFLQRVARAGMHVVDVGANIGFYSMLLAHAVGPDGHVSAFEPRSENCRLFLLGLARNGFRNVTLHPLALSNRIGHMTLRSSIGSNAWTRQPEDLTDPTTVIVPAATLDSVVEGPVDLIKADIEGAEYLALKGGEALIRRCRPIITSELSFEMSQRVSGISGPGFVQWLQSLDYRAYIVARDDGRMVEIADAGRLAAEWGDPLRIEDLAFIPRSHP
jgi:FkbM family methyltransferase